MNILRTKKYSKGLSLIELMIAMVIGLLLLLGTTSLFTNNKRIYKDQNEMGRLQENARFATEMLIQDIRMAGYIGCSDDIGNLTNNFNTTVTNLASFTNLVEGSESAANWQPSNSTEIVANMAANSDGVTVRYLQPLDINLTGNSTATTAPINAVTDLQVNELAAVTDCKASDIFRITGVTGGPAPAAITNLTHAAITNTYNTDAEVARFVTVRYYVGPGTDIDGDGVGDPALFRYVYAQDKDDDDGDGNTTEIIAHSEELIEGVENMQILYGEDTAGNDFVADTYVDAATVANWANVVSVRIALLMRTIVEDFSTPLNTDTYNLLDVNNFDPTATDDHRRRRVFTFTIQIRNQATT